jgi:poly-beta-1,6-N-acetyl-D-glucosamine biosynthesis protein PgaD
VTELVIDAPHRQTLGQQLCTLSLLMAGWCLWAYIALPLVALCGWFLGFPACWSWFDSSGRHLNPEELPLTFGSVVATLLAFWNLWARYDGWRRRSRSRPILGPAAGSAELCLAFGVSRTELNTGLGNRVVTLRFDASGRITSVKAHRKRTTVSSATRYRRLARRRSSTENGRLLRDSRIARRRWA